MLPKVSIKKFALYALGVCLLLTGVNRAQTENLRPARIITIKNGATVSHIFTIEVKKQQIISLEIKQNGMDVRAELSDPQGITIASADYPLSAQEVERIFVVADEDGNYELKVDSKFPDGGGTAAVKLGESRKSMPADLKHAEAEKLFSQAQSLRATGKTIDRRKAVEVYQQSLLVWQAINDKIGELRTLAILAYLNRISGNLKNSLEISNTILQTPDSLGYAKYQSFALYQIGQIQFQNGEVEAAVGSLRKALTLSAETPEQAAIWSTMGYFYQSDDEIEQVQNAFDRSLENIRRFPDPYNEAQTQQQMGLFDFNYNDLDLAVKNFTEAAALREKCGNRRSYAVSLTTLAMTYQRLRKYKESIVFLQKALPISAEMGDSSTQLDILIYLALAFREVGDVPKALELYQQAISFSKAANLSKTNSLYLSLAITYFQISNFAESRATFEKALANYSEIGDNGGTALTLYHFAALELAENNLDAAQTKIEMAMRELEDEQTVFKNPARLSSFLVNRRRYFDLYIDILMRLDKERPNENYAFRALQVSESARMRTLIWQYREAFKNSPQAVDFQLVSQIQKIQLQIGEQLSLLAKAQSDAAQSKNIADIEKTIADLDKQDESLKAQLRSSNPNVAGFAQPPTLSLARMQAELDDDTVLAEYSLGQKAGYLWIVGKNSFQSFVLPKRSEIETQAKSFYETLSRSNDVFDTRPINGKSVNPKTKPTANENFDEESEKLSRMLLVEKLANLPAKRLVLVADGALNLIPFGSLIFPEKDSSKPVFIAEKFETVQLPSLTTLHILREGNIKPFAPNSLAIIADPVFSGGDERLAKSRRIIKNKNSAVNTELAATLRDFNLTTLARLPFTRTEAEKIAQSSPNNTVLNLDFKASRERLFNGEFDRFDILHFATHGFLNSRHPELSGLVLSLVDEKGNAENGFLRTQDLYLLKIKPQMVVLSACQTGLGKQVENEGLIGLTRGFLAIGTPRIIATLWKVDDAATAELMSRFYRAMLKENQLPSTALRTAQNELRRIPRFSHPRYWAGFVLTGEWR